MATYPDINFSDVGGNDSLKRHLLQRCHFLEYPQLIQKMNGELPNGILLHGPIGCGKTLLANALAGEYEVPLLSVTANELVGGISGDSKANIQDLFTQAAELAPCILFIDDIDEIATKREMATKGMERRVVTQLSKSMDDLKSKKLPVLMICATNRPDSLDEAFRRTGRFDIECALRYPNRDARKSILQTLCREVKLAEDVSLSAIADLTPGFVGSDLKTLIATTNACALVRAISEYNMHRQNRMMDCEATDEGSRRKKYMFSPEDINRISVSLTTSDFQEAMTEVKLMAIQEDVMLVPNTTWDAIGGLDNIRKKFHLWIVQRTRRPELYQALDITAVRVLLVGHAGCGKKSVARAVANEAGIDFLYINGPVGNMRDLKKAGDLAPCVVFFDEIDSICPKRSSGSEEGSASRVIIQFLQEMNGLKQRNVYIIAATNRKDCLDPELLLPGRLDKIINFKLPNPEERVEILKAHYKDGTGFKLADDVSLESIGKDRRCDGFSGADLVKLVQAAREACLENIIESEISEACEGPVLHTTDSETAFESVNVSVKAEAKKRRGSKKTCGKNR